MSDPLAVGTAIGTGLALFSQAVSAYLTKRRATRRHAAETVSREEHDAVLARLADHDAEIKLLRRWIDREVVAFRAGPPVPPPPR